MLEWFALTPDRRRERWSDWCGCFLKASNGGPAAASTLVIARLQTKRPGLVDRFLEEAERVVKLEDARKAIRLARVSSALAMLAGPVLAGYARRRNRPGCWTMTT